MPRRSKGPHLYWDQTRQSWTIVDRKSRIRTGCGKGEDSRAQECLTKYLASQHKPTTSPDPLIADVISAYQNEHVIGLPSEKSVIYDLEHLLDWWAGKHIADVTAANVKGYTEARGGKSPVRRELGFLETAMRHWSQHYNPIRIPPIKRPAKRRSRQRWLTVPEAALFLKHIRKQPACRHVAQFFILGWYTGSRATVLLQLKWQQIDLAAGLLYRQTPGTILTSKEAPPVRIGRRLIGHLRRWHKLDPHGEYVISYRGKDVKRVAKGWNAARASSGLLDVHPHVLRHSRATHLLRQRVDPYEAAESLGMSIGVFQKTYGHHHPDWQHAAADAR